MAQEGLAKRPRPPAHHAQEEVRVRRALRGVGCRLEPLWGGTLFGPGDLPFT
jgi:hypothetical protein